MIVAVSKGNAQLLASRVILAQCFSSPHAHGGAHKFHSNSKLHTNGNSIYSISSPLSSSSIRSSSSSLSFTSLLSPLKINILGSFATRNSSRKKLHLPEKQRLYISSPSQLISPFIPPVSHPSIFSRSGIVSRFQSFKNKLVSLICAQQIRNKLKPFKEKFNQRIFRSTAINLYTEINKAIANNDTSKLRQMITENMFTTLSREVGLKERGKGNDLHALVWTGSVYPQIACVRFTRVSAEKLEDFAQVTVLFNGNQTLAVSDVTGKLVSSVSSPVSEFWTFERHLQKHNSSWKLCAKPTRESVENS